MNPDFADRLANPLTGNPLRLEGDRLVDEESGDTFPIRDGIPILVEPGSVHGANEQYQRLYDRLSFVYDPMVRLYARLFRGAYAVGAEIAADMAPAADAEVLEVSVGTGNQIENLRTHGYSPRMTGIDLSFGMLRRCQRKMARQGVEVNLAQSNAESLPFPADSFDMAYHFGGINFFNDKARAIHELIRVTRPGGRIFIGDETTKFMKDQPSGVNRALGLPDPDEHAERYRAPSDLIPPEMEELTCRELWSGRLYWLSFRIPG